MTSKILQGAVLPQALLRADKAVFVLSLDCEGLWGMADNAVTMTDGIISSAGLDRAYEFLGRTLDRCDVRATAAFVSAFAAPREAVMEHLREIRELAQLLPHWFGWLQPRLEKGDDAAFEGLEGHRYHNVLAKAGHEIGWHGSTHIPLLNSTPALAVDLELALARSLGASVGGMAQSVIWPRNQIGHLDRVRAAGFSSYRDGAGHGLLHRMTSMVREFNVWDRGSRQIPCNRDGWRIAPAGFFLNWPSGTRSLVPMQVTRSRWKSMLRAAVRQGGYVHMWFHPHNFITAPALQELFSEVMQEVASLIRSGDLLSLTMADANALQWEDNRA